MKMDINELFEEAKKDNVLDLDIDGILENLNKGYLETKIFHHYWMKIKKQ